MADWTSPTAIYDKCGEHGSYPATNAIDGDTDSIWYHGDSENHWIECDLGETFTVTKVRVYMQLADTYWWGHDGGIDVFVSDDPESWGAAVDDFVPSSTGWNESGAFSKSGRYIRLAIKSDGSSVDQLWEIEAEVSEVPAAGQPTMVRTQGIPTGPGSHDRAGRWN